MIKICFDDDKLLEFLKFASNNETIIWKEFNKLKIRRLNESCEHCLEGIIVQDKFFRYAVYDKIERYLKNNVLGKLKYTEKDFEKFKNDFIKFLNEEIF